MRRLRFFRQDRPMPNIRTANKRHKHAIVEQIARTKAAERAALEEAKPVKPAA
jgi:hypothetical protein